MRLPISITLDIFTILNIKTLQNHCFASAATALTLREIFKNQARKIQPHFTTCYLTIKSRIKEHFKTRQAPTIYWFQKIQNLGGKQSIILWENFNSIEFQGCLFYIKYFIAYKIFLKNIDSRNIYITPRHHGLHCQHHSVIITLPPQPPPPLLLSCYHHQP